MNWFGKEKIEKPSAAGVALQVSEREITYRDLQGVTRFVQFWYGDCPKMTELLQPGQAFEMMFTQEYSKAKFVWLRLVNCSCQHECANCF